MDRKSILGYSKGSPYRGKKFLDINTPNGLIDMSNTDIPLYAQDETGFAKVLPPHSGMHKFRGKKVREIPMQSGGLILRRGKGEVFKNLKKEKFADTQIVPQVIKSSDTESTGVKKPLTVEKDPLFYKDKKSTESLKTYVKDRLEIMGEEPVLDSDYYKAARQLLQENGNPSLDYAKSDGQSYYNPFTHRLNVRHPYHFEAEIAHSRQQTTKKNVVTQTIKDWLANPYFTPSGQDELYDIDGTMENEAHNIIQPKLDTRFINIYDSIIKDTPIINDLDTYEPKQRNSLKKIKQKGGFQDALDWLYEDEEVAPEVKSEVTAPSQDEVQVEQKPERDETYELAMSIAMQGSPEYRRSGNYQHNTGSTGFNTTSVNTGSISLTHPKPIDVNKNAQYAFDYYTKQKGLQPHVAAGIVGNLMHESGLNPNATGDGGKARGIAQWHPDRFKALQNWANKTGKNPYSLDSQLEFVLEEPGEGKRALETISKAKNAGEAAVLFSKTYERPGIPAYDKRIGYAKKLSPYDLGGMIINSIFQNEGSK